jgi:hypothetical protein
MTRAPTRRRNLLRRLSALTGLALATSLLFAAQSQATSYPVTVTLAGTGIGTVAGGNGTINCPSDCSEANYSSGSQLSLTATAGVYSVFAGWTGDCASAGTTPSCVLTVTKATNIGATFNAVSTTPAPTTTTPTPHKKCKKKKHRAAAAKKKCKKKRR